MIDRFERFSLGISEIYRYWHKIASDEMACYGLKGPYAVYLMALYRREEGITAVQLGEICNRNKADVSRAISDMEAKGILQRGSNNRYRALLTLTEEGKRAAQHLGTRIDRAVESAGAGLTEENRTIFYESLALIAANLREISEEGLPR